MSRDVPSGWSRALLSDLITLEYGKSLPEKARVAGQVPVFGSSGLVGYHSQALVKGPGILVGRKGTVGKVVRVDEDFWPIDTTYFVSPRVSVDQLWLFYVLSHLDLARLNEATGVPGLNRDKAGREHVMLPPLPEQRRIAEILSSVDEAIQATEAVIQQTGATRDATLKMMFTGQDQGGPKSPASDWRIGRLPVAEIPRNWEVVKLVEVAKLESGHTPSRRHPEYWGGDVPWISLHDTQALTKREIGDTEQKTTPLGIANSSARMLPSGTVVFSRTATVGLSAIMSRQMATSQDFANFICGPRIDNRFLMHLLKFMRLVWPTLSSGSVHKTIYMPVFQSLQIALPPLDVQKRIAAVADSFFDSIETSEKRLFALRETKAALSADLLTGRKRVTDTMALAAE